MGFPDLGLQPKDWWQIIITGGVASFGTIVVNAIERRARGKEKLKELQIAAKAPESHLSITVDLDIDVFPDESRSYRSPLSLIVNIHNQSTHEIHVDRITARPLPDDLEGLQMSLPVFGEMTGNTTIPPGRKGTGSLWSVKGLHPSDSVGPKEVVHSFFKLTVHLEGGQQFEYEPVLYLINDELSDV